MKQILFAGLLALALQAQNSGAGGQEGPLSNSFLDKKGFVVGLGYSYASAKIDTRYEFFGTAVSRDYVLTDLAPSFSAGYKYNKFLISATIESFNLKKEDAEIKCKNMLGLINFDALLGEKDTFAILGVGFSNYKFEDDDEDFGLGGVLRAGLGRAHRIKDDTYLVASLLFKYSLKQIEYKHNSASATFGSLLSLGVNVGLAF